MESVVKMESDSDDVVFVKWERSIVSDEVNLLSPVSTIMPKPIKLLPSPVKPPQKTVKRKRNVSLDNPGAATESLVITRAVSLEPSNIKLVVNINTSTCQHKERKRKKTDSKSKKEVPEASSDQSDVAFVPQVPKKSEHIHHKERKCKRTHSKSKRAVPKASSDQSDVAFVPLDPKKNEDVHHKERKRKRTHSKIKKEVPKASNDQSDEAFVPQVPKKSKDVHHKERKRKRTHSKIKKEVPKASSDQTDVTFVPQVPKKSENIPKPGVLNRIVPKCLRRKCMPDTMERKTRTEGTGRGENNNNIRKCSHSFCREKSQERSRELRRKCHEDVSSDRRHKHNRSMSPREKRHRKEDRQISLSLSPVSPGSIADSKISYDEITSDNFSTNSEDELDTLIKRTKKREWEMVRKQWSNKTERGFRPIRSPLPFAEIHNASTPNNFDENSDATIFSSDMDVTIHSLSTVVLDHHVDLEVYSPTMSPNEYVYPRACLDDTIQLNAAPQIEELEDSDAMKIKNETNRPKDKRSEASGLETKNIKRETNSYSNQENINKSFEPSNDKACRHISSRANKPTEYKEKQRHLLQLKKEPYTPSTSPNLLVWPRPKSTPVTEQKDEIKQIIKLKKEPYSPSTSPNKLVIPDVNSLYCSESQKNIVKVEIKLESNQGNDKQVIHKKLTETKPSTKYLSMCMLSSLKKELPLNCKVKLDPNNN